ncbi:zf-CCHC domain-containing protein [Tanacetum coccineum]
MADYSQKWHNGTSRSRSTETSNGLVVIQAQLNNLGREIKKVNEKVYAAQVGCEICKGDTTPKTAHRKKKEKLSRKLTTRSLVHLINPEGNTGLQVYRATGPGFYQRNNANSSYTKRRQSLEESLAKFMAESTKRHEENSAIIKVIRASSDTAIRNLGASIKILELQIGQMSKNGIRHIGSYQYAISNLLNRNLCSEYKQNVPFPKRLCGYNSEEACKWELTETYPFGVTNQEGSTPQKQKDPGSFTLPSFIYDNCFEKSLVDLGASVSVMPYSTYVNLGLRILTKTNMTIELADRSIKYPKGIVENMLVRIGKFTFPIDFVVLDIPKDKDIPLILGRPFLSTAHVKIDVFKRKISLRVGKEKIVFESVKIATSIIKKVYMLSLRERMDLDLEARLMGETLILNKSFDPLYGDYIELIDLNIPMELRRDQGVELEPTTEDGEVDYEPLVNIKNRNNARIRGSHDYSSLPNDRKLTFSCKIGYRRITADIFHILSVNTMTKDFYHSVIKDKKNQEEKIVGTLIEIPVFVGNFSIFSDFEIIDVIYQGNGLKDVVLGMPFFKEFVIRRIDCLDVIVSYDDHQNPFVFVVLQMTEEKEKDVEDEFKEVPDVIASQGSSSTSDPKKPDSPTPKRPVVVVATGASVDPGAIKYSLSSVTRTDVSVNSNQKESISYVMGKRKANFPGYDDAASDEQIMKMKMSALFILEKDLPQGQKCQLARQ